MSGSIIHGGWRPPEQKGDRRAPQRLLLTIVGVSAAGFSGIDPARSPQVRIPILMKPLMTPGSDQFQALRHE